MSDKNAVVVNLSNYSFRKDAILGNGSFAIVFRGVSKSDKSLDVAVKSISKKNISKIQTLLLKEIKILQGLRHDNIVQLYDCESSRDGMYLVMEYCNGGDLADYLSLKHCLSEQTIFIFMKQVVLAMGFLHSKAIVHRDLKPQNLLLSYSKSIENPSPSDIQIKIGDFGFARYLEGADMAATLCGSPMYMAPEVLMSQNYDSRADLWSIGTIMYQCLTNRAPFHATNPQNLKHFYEKHTKLTISLPLRTSPELNNLLNGLLRRNPDDRLSFKEFFNHEFFNPTEPRRTFSGRNILVPSRQRNSGSSNSSSPEMTPVTHSVFMPQSPDGLEFKNTLVPDSKNSGARRKTSVECENENDFVIVSRASSEELQFGRLSSPETDHIVRPIAFQRQLYNHPPNSPRNAFFTVGSPPDDHTPSPSEKCSPFAKLKSIQAFDFKPSSVPNRLVQHSPEYRPGAHLIPMKIKHSSTDPNLNFCHVNSPTLKQGFFQGRRKSNTSIDVPESHTSPDLLTLVKRAHCKADVTQNFRLMPIKSFDFLLNDDVSSVKRVFYTLNKHSKYVDDTLQFHASDLSIETILDQQELDVFNRLKSLCQICKALNMIASEKLSSIFVNEPMGGLSVQIDDTMPIQLTPNIEQFFFYIKILQITKECLELIKNNFSSQSLSISAIYSKYKPIIQDILREHKNAFATSRYLLRSSPRMQEILLSWEMCMHCCNQVIYRRALMFSRHAAADEQLADFKRSAELYKKSRFLFACLALDSKLSAFHLIYHKFIDLIDIRLDSVYKCNFGAN